MAGFGQDQAALAEPRDTVPAAVIRKAADEISRELAARLVLAFRDVFRR